jgi:hypothetical protein
VDRRWIMRSLFPYLILLLFLLVLPVKAQPYELAYDDGTAEAGFDCTVGCIAAVKFSVNSPVQILMIRYFMVGGELPYRIHVLDSNFNSIFLQNMQPPVHEGWYRVDIPPANIVVNGDFFVGVEWIEPRGRGPWLGADIDSPPRGRSYVGNLSSPPVLAGDQNFLIRVVVQKAPAEPSSSPSPSPPSPPSQSSQQDMTLIVIIPLIIAVIFASILIRRRKSDEEEVVRKLLEE